jgi:chondroitin AC lyase
MAFAPILLVLLSCSTFCNCQATNDDFAIIRQRILEMELWPSKDNISNIVELAVLYNRTINSSCYWEDINYADRTIAVWATEEHLIRVNYMLQALTVPGSSLQNNSQLATAVHCALNVWLVRDWLNPNWWFNQIGIPLLISSELLMLGDNATDFEIEKITEISYRANWWEHDPGTGANLIWMLQVELYRSIATNNRTGLEEGIKRMWRDIVVLPLGGQGIQNDWSYHFHGAQLYPAGYGQDWAVAMMIFMVSTKGTQYEADQEQLAIFANFLTQGDAWMINDNIWDWQVQGRTFDRFGTVFASLGFEVESDWIRSLAELVNLDNLKTDLLNFADRLDAKSNAIPLLGNKHFYTSDYQAHRRANWTSAIKMQSVRTQPTECINGENQKGEHLGQGVLTVYTTNASDYVEIFPLLDWQAINGITVEHDIPLEPCKGGGFSWIQQKFVGGVSDGKYGLAMMDTATHNLTAKRSWHFYDDGIIALASNLTVNSKSTAWTTLVSRLLPKGIVTIGFFNGTIISLSDGINYSFPYTDDKKQNVQWIHLSESNLGYLLQTQGLYSAIGAEVSTKTASYNTIGPYNDTVTKRTVTVWIDHGLGPYTRDYSYIILPNVSVTSMPELIKRYDNEHLFSCISNSDLFHGVAWPTLQRTSFVLWNNIPTTFSCQSPSFKINAELSDDGVYLFNETATDFSVTVSHPTRINSTVTITVDRVGLGQRCVASSGSKTDVTIALPSSPQLLGSSVTVTCKKKQARLRQQ